MVKGLVTIVLPIYNVEKYLDRCIESVVNQTYRNLEILLIDDGSPDKCPQLCDAWAEKDSRIHVVHKKNEGLGYARNTGIERANGEYICFFDSDDYVEKSLIEKCYSAIKSTNADIVHFGNDEVLQDKRVRKTRVPCTPQNVYQGNEICDKLVPRFVSYNAKTGENWNLLLSAWSTLISMRLIEDLKWRFVSEREIISEDFYSMMELYQQAKKVFILPEILYHYSVNPVSLSRCYRQDRYSKIKILIEHMHRLSTHHLEAELATMCVGLIMGAVRQLVASEEPFFIKKTYIAEMLNDQFLQEQVRLIDDYSESLAKKAFYWSLRKKSVSICFILAVLRNLKG